MYSTWRSQYDETPIVIILSHESICSHRNYYTKQWNLSIADTLRTAESVLISEVSSFQGQFCTQLYLAGTLDSVLIKVVSLYFRGVLIEGFHRKC